MALPNFFVFDTETGGLDATENPITEFAGIIVDAEFNEINRFQTFIKPYGGLKITQAALDKTMTTMDQINKGCSIEEFGIMVQKFAKQGNVGKGQWLRKPELVGHNVPFDIAFMTVGLAFSGLELSDLFGNNNGIVDYHDTIKLARLRWPKFKSDEDSKYRLISCCERMGITLHDAHGAMADTVATLKLFKAFSGVLSSENGKVSKVSNTGQESAEEEVKPRAFFKF
jgi:DNA polymerase III subunit alpha, Gram-positive type